LGELDNAFDAAAPSLRPLSPGSLPPPLRLPPPPAAALRSAGDLVIDQPSFLRQNWPQQKLASADAIHPASDVGPPVHEVPQPPPVAPPVSSRPFPPVAEPHPLASCPPQPLPPPDAALPTFRVKPFSVEAKHWTPSQQQTPATFVPPSQQQQQQQTPSYGVQPFQVSHHVPQASIPAKWQPTETPLLVRSHAEVHLDPEPAPVEVTTSWPTPPPVHVGLRLERVDGQTDDVEVVPRWALPLRSEYDWREVYYWGDSDDWEITDDGQYCIRKSKNQSSLMPYRYST